MKTDKNIKKCDVAIIGAGPSGAIAAALLKKADHHVIVLEKEHFPRFEIQGKRQDKRYKAHKKDNAHPATNKRARNGHSERLAALSFLGKRMPLHHCWDGVGRSRNIN